MTFTLLAPAAVSADGGAGGPYYLAVFGAERFVRGGEVLQESDFDENFRPQVGDQFFFTEALYHSNARGAKGTRAGRTIVTCTVGIRQTFMCEGSMTLRGQGALYLITYESDNERFLAAVTGGTRDFKAARGDVVITSVSRNRSLYQLRLR